MTQFISFKDTLEGKTGIYHIGIQGRTGTSFSITVDKIEQLIDLGPAGQWEVYSENLKEMNIEIKLGDNSQIGYIELYLSWSYLVHAHQ